MLKNIVIVFSFLIFSFITSCSMWDDVDKNAAFVIPVSNINVDSGAAYAGGFPIPAQWNDIPVVLNTFTGSGTQDKDITEIKAATNLAMDRLFIKIQTSLPLIDLFAYNTSYVILLSADLNCNGKKFLIIPNNYGRYNICDSISIAPTDSFSSAFYTTNRVNSPFLEISIDVNSVGINLLDGFLLSVYSTGNVIPYMPYKSSFARWVKFPD